MPLSSFQRPAGLMLALALAAAAPARAQSPGLHRPNPAGAPAAARATVQSAQAPLPPLATTTEDGRQCSVITFEGVGNLAPIPEFDGIQSPGWLGIIDADAGGTGNFANEPSPQTIAFWLGGDPSTRDIVLTNKASRVAFLFTSSVPVTMEALDETGAVLDRAVGAPNYNGGSGDPTGDFNRWDPLSVSADGNRIKTVRVSGNTNQTGIDNLKVCNSVGVAAVEATQAIQQLQTLDALKASLQAGREPPVPLVAGKPGVLRFYMEKVNSVTPVTLQLSGAINQTRQATLQPQCEVEDQRRERNGCRALDFYFMPPEGNWDVTAKVVDASGQALQTTELPFRSRKTDSLTLKAVSVCDARTAAGAWQCAGAAALGSRVSLLRRLMPSRSVGVNVTNSFIRRDYASYATEDDWWSAAAKDANDLFGLFDLGAGLFGNHRVYYGMVRAELPGGIGGMAYDIPAHAALGRVSAIRLGVETTHEVVAHETGHTLGLQHTNTATPGASGTPPGCYNLAEDPGTDWPFADNLIRSAAGLEVGFDVAAHRPLMPESTFEMMGYCVPRWISPFSYKKTITALGGGSIGTTAFRAEAEPPRAVTAEGRFWSVSGTIGMAATRLDPVFEDSVTGRTDSGTGTYRIDVRDAAGAVLYTRGFTPAEGHTETTGKDVVSDAAFFELIPVTAGAARIAVVGPAGTTLAVRDLGGTAPVVRLAPLPGGELAGRLDVSWTVDDPDSTAFSTKVFYSRDNGRTWSQVGAGAGLRTVALDLDSLPGSAGAALVRVLVSDGANTGAAVSPPFSVARKLPVAQVIAPPAGTAVPRQTLVQLEGFAYDADDGLLDGAAVQWTSNLDGVLGTGAVLDIDTLRPGRHTITLRARDADGNPAQATTRVNVAGSAPLLALNVTPLDTLPTTCVEAAIAASADPAVDLARVEYSLDGGATWTNLPSSSLPFRFIVPGSGYFHLVARAFDTAGQVTASDSKFFTQSACQQSGTPRLDGTVRWTAGAPGTLNVDLLLANTGTGSARAVRIDKVALRTLSGSGTPSLVAPALPLAVGDIAAGASATVRLQVAVPAGVRRFALTETGQLTDGYGRVSAFSINQAVTP